MSYNHEEKRTKKYSTEKIIEEADTIGKRDRKDVTLPVYRPRKLTANSPTVRKFLTGS